MKHLEQHKLLSDQQNGFRKRRSCESQLLLTVQDLASSLEVQEQIDCLLLDFSKAFDKVPHQRLAQKLFNFGIRGTLLNWIKSFLSDPNQRQSFISASTSDIWSATGLTVNRLLFAAFLFRDSFTRY